MLRKGLLYSVVLIYLYGCNNTTANINTQKITMQQDLDISIINNKYVQQAIAALQANDINAWYHCFITQDVIFTDDGKKMDFKSFFDNAFDKKENFLTIDAISEEGKYLEGNFYAGQWGTFKVYFRFHLNAKNQIERLDIGQKH